MRMTAGAAALLVGLGFLAGVAASRAQAPGEVKRTILLTKALAAQGYNGIVGRGEVPAGMAGPAHFHYGDELVILLEGEVEVEVEGAAPVRIKAGEAMHVEAGKVHKPKSVGTVPAKFISVWVVEQDKPLAVNAP
jgi:quercetin dioxygenase-like cupin family protein